MLLRMNRWTSIILILCVALVSLGARKRPRVGKLQVNSLNAGAEVFVNGKLRGTIPLSAPLRLRVGKHRLRVSLAGHADFLDTIRIRKRRTTRVDISLIAVTGVLTIEGQPDGAEVLIDDALQGQIPFRGTVEPGRHDVEVRAPGFTSYFSPLELSPGEEKQIDVNLVRIPEQLPVSVEAWYENAWVWAGAASVVLTAVIAGVVAASEDGATDSKRPLIRVETIR